MNGLILTGDYKKFKLGMELFLSPLQLALFLIPKAVNLGWELPGILTCFPLQTDPLNDVF